MTRQNEQSGRRILPRSLPVAALAAGLVACAGPGPGVVWSGGSAAAPPPPELRAELTRADSAELAGLRAGGDGDGVSALGANERSALAAAQAASPQLADQRAGDLSDREIAIIAITVGVIVLLILLL